VGLAWLNYPDSYDGSNVATVRVSHVREIKDGDPTKSDTLVLQVGGQAWG